LLSRTIICREELLPANHPNIASSLLHVANCLKAQGKYTQAQTHFRRALTILETTLGKNHLDVASLLISLATCSQHARGEVNEADALLTRALSIRRSQLDPKHVDVVKLEQVITDLRTQ
jgi:tetratricopeptide (TPR) repeat protein